ncbi:MAG: cyclomaltodextrinase N-terminal domain-containing protein [Clostridium sp.]|nr:cyclomaltodextrinase N-terminal domain-containing protein [Prevotella sp.]MCM1378124.1 cyclomaltodextrinase N-terminal domain-containing protein [Prevotella sp.]MCM1428942.1 cyclomaltodextrinase N-terminal domain-containing protein [Clostridium sp.]
MNKSTLLTGSLILASALCAMARIRVESKQTPHRRVGMKSQQLQLQVYGEDLAGASLTVDAPGVSVDSIARLDGSSKWLYAYLNISPRAKPGDGNPDNNVVKSKKYPAAVYARLFL